MKYKNILIKSVIIMIGFLAVSTLHARDYVALDKKDAILMGQIKSLSWQTESLSEFQEEQLFNYLKHPHIYVAEAVLAAAAAKQARTLPAMLEYAAVHLTGDAKKLAEYITILSARWNIFAQLTSELEQVAATGKIHGGLPQYTRDILVNHLALEARRNHKQVAIPQKIYFTPEQKAILEFSWKQEAEAFVYLSNLAANEKNVSRIYAYAWALSAYDRVFFDEAVASLKRHDLPQQDREFLGIYLQLNQWRLTEEQRIDSVKLLKEVGYYAKEEE